MGALISRGRRLELSAPETSGASAPPPPDTGRTRSCVKRGAAIGAILGFLAPIAYHMLVGGCPDIGVREGSELLNRLWFSLTCALIEGRVTVPLGVAVGAVLGGFVGSRRECPT